MHVGGLIGGVERNSHEPFHGLFGMTEFITDRPELPSHYFLGSSTTLFILFTYSRKMPTSPKHPSTPDGRYFVVAGRLWRMSNPGLAPEERQKLVEQLMNARRQVGAALKAGDAEAERGARAAVDAAKRALGERGPVWWTDGAPDLNRRLVANTPYARWHDEVLSSD